MVHQVASSGRLFYSRLSSCDRVVPQLLVLLAYMSDGRVGHIHSKTAALRYPQYRASTVCVDMSQGEY